MRAAHHLVLWLMAAGCRLPAPTTPGAAAPAEIHHEVEPSALVAVTPPAEHAELAARETQTVWVGGCNTACIDCSLASYQTFVVGTLTRTGAQLFPSPDPPVPGYSCGAEVAVGERVTLIAHSPTEHMVIDSWSTFRPGDSCPCIGQHGTTCTFEVTAEIAAHHDRIYCGAAWRQPGAQLAD